jgi:hypothetical protein
MLLFGRLQTRGYKVIVRWLPHEVSDVETVLDMLSKEDHQDATVHTAYICLN